MTTRDFIKTSAFGLSGAVLFPDTNYDSFSFSDHINKLNDCSDNQFWKMIRDDYELPKKWINLENGYYCIQPKPILQSYINHVKYVNQLGAFYMRNEQFKNKSQIASQLAETAGCNAEELIITRNTTESLDLIISGYPWQFGDEAIVAEQDYGAMLDMFQQMVKRYGIVVKTIQLPKYPQSDSDIIDIYKSAISSKTKLIMACHIINITGQIIPIRKLCDMAHTYGVEVMVDGAHSMAHLDFKIMDLNCDYFGCSLHKWLSNPLGAGLLYVNKQHISKLWPLFAEAPLPDWQIARLNHTGTIPVHVDLTLPDALLYYKTIGAQRKQNRLRELQRYWTDQIRGKSRIILQTPEAAERSCAIANVGIEGMRPSELAEILFKTHSIYTVAIEGKGVQGCRITPNVYTSFEELDVLIKALLKIASET
ncbi:MAG: aminotransferase class V-fold PLP-dependent enzyme [Sphingobacteriia bacterium]|nr:aminotransferase class V-fold PLP-dependent enzyme [Sphingobacteriia bacterium]